MKPHLSQLASALHRHSDLASFKVVVDISTRPFAYVALIGVRAVDTHDARYLLTHYNYDILKDYRDESGWMFEVPVEVENRA